MSPDARGIYIYIYTNRDERPTGRGIGNDQISRATPRHASAILGGTAAGVVYNSKQEGDSKTRPGPALPLLRGGQAGRAVRREKLRRKSVRGRGRGRQERGGGVHRRIEKGGGGR